MSTRIGTIWLLLALGVGCGDESSDAGASGTPATAGTPAAMTGGTTAAGTGGVAGSSVAEPISVAPADLAGACPLETRVGGFEITHRETFAFATGEVREAVHPLSVTALVTEAGGCQLRRKENPHCATACAAGELCSPDLMCVPAPVKMSLGSVTVEGLRQPVTMQPDASNDYSAMNPAFPLFDTGSGIRLTAAEAGAGGVSLLGIGVETLVLTNSDWVMRRDQPLELAWTPGSSGARVYFTFNVDQHGNSPVTMFCDLEDTGSAQVDATIVNALLDAGISGAGSANAFRQTMDSADIAQGCIDLRVASHVRGMLRVE